MVKFLAGVLLGFLGGGICGLSFGLGGRQELDREVNDAEFYEDDFLVNDLIWNEEEGEKYDGPEW